VFIFLSNLLELLQISKCLNSIGIIHIKYGGKEKAIVPLGQPTSASSPTQQHGPASPGLKAHGRSRGGAAMARWWWQSADSGKGRWRGGGETVLGGSRRGGKHGKLTGRLVYGSVTRAGKHNDDGTVRVRGQPVPGPGSTRATLGVLEEVLGGPNEGQRRLSRTRCPWKNEADD
jgi:hypothetical protein